MISLTVRDASGSEVGTYEFDPAEIAPGVNKQLLHDVVVMYEANRRVGTVRTKSRAEVHGSTRKLYRQKGTGRARAGQIRTPIRRGGGDTFAKRPRNYGYRLPKKAVRRATRMALLSKFLDEQVTLLEGISLAEPKTRLVAALLKALGLAETSCLLAVEEHEELVWRSSRNIANLRVLPVQDLNAYELLRQRQLVLTTAALDRLRRQNGGQPAADEDD